MFLLREVRPADLDELTDLARQLNTLNLPDDPKRLEKLIATSRSSFGGRFDDARDREMVFVLRDLAADRLIGTCLVIAQHGTYQRPAVYFEVRDEQKYSTTLDRYFRHQVLQLSFDYDGGTEIGGLILHPDYRGHRLKLGKLLSYVRFLYIGMHREWFRDRIIAELLPPLNADGTSDLWNCLGANFTGLDYTTADRLSRENVEFIRSLFPNVPIYTALLPEQVRDKIGVVGDKTRPVAKMLGDIGFDWNRSIDPFDGGPTYACPTDRCEPVQRTCWQPFAGPMAADEPADGQALIGFEYETHMVRFRAAFGEYRLEEGGELRFRSPVLNRLRIEPGQRCAFLPLTGPELQALY